MYNQLGTSSGEITVRATPNLREMDPAVGAGFGEFTVAYGEPSSKPEPAAPHVPKIGGAQVMRVGGSRLPDTKPRSTMN